MRQIRRCLTWYVLLNKRLLKKYSFLLILCMVPCLILGFRAAAREDSNILRIALYADVEDAAGQKVIDDFLGEDSVISYMAMQSEDEAVELLERGEADAAWIFERPLDDSLKDASNGRDMEDMVKVLQREDNMLLRLARVKLYTGIYPHVVYSVYEEFVRGHLGGAEGVSDEKIRDYFDTVYVEDSIFEMSYLDADEKAEDETSYLLSPVRGMLSLWLVLVGLASAMYFLQDEKEGLFDWIPLKRRYLLMLGYHLTAVVDGAVVMLLAQFLTGNFVSLPRELLCMFLFVWMVVGFCMLLQMLCRKVEWLGSTIPILMLLMLVLCPVFLNLREFHLVQCLLPPYHYLRSLHDVRTVLDMAVYAAVASAMGYAAFWMRARR